MFKILTGLRFLFRVFFGGFEFSLTLVMGDDDAKLLLRDVSFIKLQLFVVLNDMSV
jgi:hypothetical protein